MPPKRRLTVELEGSRLNHHRNQSAAEHIFIFRRRRRSYHRRKHHSIRRCSDLVACRGSCFPLRWTLGTVPVWSLSDNNPSAGDIAQLRPNL
ncbi:hypothetical protein PGT21_022629 [Puccinia graminis f. sp. tritici]|uniref:Uncharacterized protein n=1 Tax=Puccinia graminis f. sp. tritici TaxID=56615 RepID=A0A5B0S4Q2_PUCGR|nr:hypothetical protein PGT21_022629 [Puccinia graminis f. sp. tritici]KAA1132807.1 hypothetical protein PGTUg99_017499 [Puccinia graminis f. sp. tritici]